jgi:hypothetical protein
MCAGLKKERTINHARNPAAKKKEVIQKYSVRTLRESRETQRPLAIRAACLH